MSSIPPFIPYPPAPLKDRVPAAEWDRCYETWALLCKAYNSLPQKQFLNSSASAQSVSTFLVDFVAGESYARSHQTPPSKACAEARKEVFKLTFRVLDTTSLDPTSGLLSWRFLGSICKLYGDSSAVRKLVAMTWQKHQVELERSLQSLKDHLISSLDAGDLSLVDNESFSASLLPLMHSLPPTATFFITGSDLLDSIISAYPKSSQESRQRLLMLVYLGLTSLTTKETSNISLLADHLFILRASAEKSAKTPASSSLTQDLVTETSFISRTKRSLEITPSKSTSRAQSLLDTLTSFRRPTGPSLRPNHSKPKSKGKAKANGTSTTNANGGLHVHTLSLISQIQDLFPDLGSAFIATLLDNYSNDVETVTAQLLDNSLPPHIASLDRTTQLPPSQFSTTNPDLVPDLVPGSTPPLTRATSPSQNPSSSQSLPIRRNIHDSDALDNLSPSALSRVRLGKKNENITADSLLATASTGPDEADRKARILSALAAFDADDDERDDTYDLEDVGGTVDNDTAPGNEKGAPNTGASTIDASSTNTVAEEILFKAFKADERLFERDSVTRRSKARTELKKTSGLTDEAIEGWAVMVRREPRRLRKLEDAFAGKRVEQDVLRRTRWTAESEEDSFDDDGDDDGHADREVGAGNSAGGRGGGSSRGTGGGGRGRGRGGRGGRGNVAGPNDEKGTQVARHRKEASKGSRANHNRRDQRARKMARGGGMMG